MSDTPKPNSFGVASCNIQDGSCEPSRAGCGVASCNKTQVTKSRIITTCPLIPWGWADSGNLYLDEMGGVWRKGWMSETETVDSVRLGSVEGRCQVEPAEEADLDRLRAEWSRVAEEGQAERAERWAEFWRSR